MTPARLLAAARDPAADADLLHAWATARDGGSFTELVRRYGPLVWAACRANAGDTPAAEDAFQATFLALARRAGRVTSVPGFLHRTATRAARKAARRDRRRPAPPATASIDPLDRLTARELLQAVDAEIARLPERQRLAVLVCGVEGLSLDEAAARLGWTPGAVRGRLQRGRATLRARLAAKGLTVPAVFGLGVVPDRLTAAVRPGGPVPARVAELVSGGLAMKLTLGGLVLAAGLLVGGLGWATDKLAADPPPAPAAGPLTLWEGKTDGAGSAVWHLDGKHVLAVGAFDPDPGKPQEVRAWDAATGELVKRFPVPLPNLLLLGWGGVLAVSPDGKTVAAGTWRGAGATKDAAAVWAWDRPADPPKLLPLKSHANGLVFRRDGTTLYALASAGRLSAFRVGRDATEWYGKDIPIAPDFDGGLVGLAAVLHPMADVLAVGQNDMRVSLWQAGSLRPLDSLALDGLGPKPLAFSPDGRRLVMLADGGTRADPQLRLATFNVTPEDGGGVSVRRSRLDRMPLPPLRDPDGRGMEHSSFDPSGRFLAVAFRDGAVRVLDTGTGTVVLELPESDGRVNAAAFAPTGPRLLVSAKGAVRVHDLAGRLAPKPVPDLRLTHEKELDRFAGRWVIARFRIDGADKADAVGAEGLVERLEAVDPAVTPRAANFRNMAGPGAGGISYAIYEFPDPDTLRVCFNRDRDRRPTAFTAEKGERQSLVVYRRAE